MAKIHGFNLRKRLAGVSKWIYRKTRIQTQTQTQTQTRRRRKPIAKLLNWGCKLTSGAKSLFNGVSGSGYTRLRSDPDMKVPKGHLAVYLGQEDGELERVMVPVIYFNHPLFSELLREAEEKYGFQHHGGITIPCRVTEFERVKTRIASGSPTCTRRTLTTWRLR